MFGLAWEFEWKDLLVLILILASFLAFFFVRRYLKKQAVEGVDVKFVRGQWQKIEELLSYGQEMNYKLAVIEADKMLDFVLKAMYFPGEKMSDRLKLATYKYPSLKKVWWAHKVRNQVVHEPRYTLKFNETKKVVSLFKNALKELGAL